MAFFERIFDMLCDHTAVVNNDPTALQKEVELVQKEVGPWVRVRGFTDFRQLFLALHIAKAKKHPFSVAYIQSDEEIGQLVLKRAVPDIKTIKYSDTQNLAMLMPVAR